MNVFLGILIFIFGLSLGTTIVFVLWLMETSREINDCKIKIASIEADLKCDEERLNELDEEIEEILKGENHE